MESLTRSSFGTSRADGVVKKGLLCKRTARDEWRLPGREDALHPDGGYVVSFLHFHERDATPRDFVPPLAPKKVLRVLTAYMGRTVTPPMTGGGAAEKAAGPPTGAASAAATGGGVLQSGTEQGLTPVPPSASVADPMGQDAAPGVPPPGEVINLDDEAEEEPAGEASASRASATEGAVTETGAPTLAATTEMLAAAQQIVTDLRAPEQEAREGARRAEDKFQAIIEKALLNAEVFWAAAKKARSYTEELARLNKDHEALQNTIERIRHEWHKAWQERDFEASRKAEVEKMATDLGEEVSQLHVQVQGLQTAMSKGLDREHLLKAQSEGKVFVVPLFCGVTVVSDLADFFGRAS
nr:uncharacterized protein LOC117864564 [Setaria viridis]